MHTRVLTVILALLAPATAARATDKAIAPTAYTCMPELAAAEREFALPAKLLHTIAIVETGRPDPVSGRVTPWPWTITVGGVGRYFETKDAAIAAVRDLQAAGIRSIDVGCMQINLMHHPDAFASLDEAFDPRSNTRYGARFLSALYHETGNWLQAAAAYHSRTQDEGARYETRVMAIWPLADRFPDPTLRSRGDVTEPALNLTNYTPEFAAEVRQMRTRVAHLAAMSGPPGQPRSRPGRLNDRGYTPELAAEMRQASRFTIGRTVFRSPPNGRSVIRIASQGGR